MKNRRWLLLSILLFVSCQSYTVDYRGQLFKHEWVSFDVATIKRHNGLIITEYPREHVILHNRTDSTQDIYLIKENELVKITPEAMLHVLKDYQQICYFPAHGKLYHDCIAQTLQQGMWYFPMYFPTYDNSWLRLEDAAKNSRKTTDDTMAVFLGHMTERHCYSDGHCELEEEPVLYWYSKTYGSFVKAKQFHGFNGEVESTITNICYNDMSSYIDSVFDNTRFNEYERLSPDVYYPYLTHYTDNIHMTDTVLNWPIVNLATGDTTTLRQMQGSTLLFFFYFQLGNELYSSVQQAFAGINNVVWLMPFGGDVELLKQGIVEEKLGDNIYYTKWFTKHLSEKNDAYLINASHQTEACFNRDIIDFDKWVEKLKKEGKI